MTQATVLCLIALFSSLAAAVRAQKWVGTQDLAKGEKAPFGRSNYKHHNPTFKGGVGCASLALDRNARLQLYSGPLDTDHGALSRTSRRPWTTQERLVPSRPHRPQMAQEVLEPTATLCSKIIQGDQIWEI